MTFDDRVQSTWARVLPGRISRCQTNTLCLFLLGLLKHIAYCYVKRSPRMYEEMIECHKVTFCFVWTGKYDSNTVRVNANFIENEEKSLRF
jgi:hypothetical protein